jgi:hypothetical protein
VGFLFAHDCHRTTPIGCPDCHNGEIDDPFAERRDRYGYSRYDSYDDGYYMGYGRHSWSSSSSSDTVTTDDSSFDSTGDDFTEADGGDLQTDDSSDDSSDGGFESDSSES